MRRSVLLAAAFAFGAGIYLPSIGHGFVWDDRTLIAENRYLHDAREIGRNLTSDFFRRSGEPTPIGHWRPIVTASYMADWGLGGGSAATFHLTNALLHGAAAALVALLALRLGLPASGALLAALLFGAHPSHVEAVAWISGRTDLLCAVFVLGALVLDAGAPARPGLRVGAGAMTFVALLAKEMAVVVPFAVALRAWWLEPPGAPGKRAARAALPHLVAIGLYAAIRLGALGLSPLPPRAAEAGRVALFTTWWSGFLEYARVLVWPWRLSIVSPVALVRSPLDPRVLGGAALFAALVVVAWSLRRRAPVVAWGIASGLLAFGPLVNFVIPVRAIASVPFPWAERFLVVPTLFFAVAAGAAIVRAGPRRALVLGLAAALVVAGTARTLARERVWRDQRSLFEATVREAPGDAPSRVALGAALLDAGDVAGAETQLRHALALAPGDAFGEFNLGNLLRGRGDLAGAEAAYRAALATRPGYAQALLNLGLVLASRGALDEAERSFREADAALGGYPEAKVDLATLLRIRGRVDEARALYRDALVLDPGFAPARAGLAAIGG